METCCARSTVPGSKSRGSYALRGQHTHRTMSALHNPTDLPSSAQPGWGHSQQQVIVPKTRLASPLSHLTRGGKILLERVRSCSQNPHTTSGKQHSGIPSQWGAGHLHISRECRDCGWGDTLQSPAPQNHSRTSPKLRSPSPIPITHPHHPLCRSLPGVPSDTPRAGCPQGVPQSHPEQ